MEDKLKRIFWLVLVAAIIFSVLLNGCAYITGEYPATTVGSMPRWVWSLGDSGYSIIVDRQTNQAIRDVTPDEAFGIIGTSERSDYPVILDVRTLLEYDEGHIHHAINIDYNSSGFKDEINKVSRDELYIVYCHSGHRSSAARDVMEGLGFKHVINVTGGFSEWVAEGLPVDK